MSLGSRHLPTHPSPFAGQLTRMIFHIQGGGYLLDIYFAMERVENGALSLYLHGRGIDTAMRGRSRHIYILGKSNKSLYLFSPDGENGTSDSFVLTLIGYCLRGRNKSSVLIELVDFVFVIDSDERCTINKTERTLSIFDPHAVTSQLISIFFV